MSHRDGDLLNEIVEAAGHIAQFTPRGRESFDRDVTLQYATAHGLVLIGEAAGKLSPELCERHPDVPWRQSSASGTSSFTSTTGSTSASSGTSPPRKSPGSPHA